MRPDWEHELGNDRLQESEKEKDLGVVTNNRLPSEEPIQKKVRNMHNLLGNMRVGFTYVDEEMVKKIIKENNYIIHSNPHLKKHIEKIEKVQRAATRWVPSLRDLSYEERL